MKDYYKILQVDRSADSELIKKIFNYHITSPIIIIPLTWANIIFLGEIDYIFYLCISICEFNIKIIVFLANIYFIFLQILSK